MHSKKERPAFYDSDNLKTNLTLFADSIYQANPIIENCDIIAVPFREENGVKYVAVSVDGFGFEMIFDTGCSGTLIPVSEQITCMKRSTLKKKAILANHNHKLLMVVLLKTWYPTLRK